MNATGPISLYKLRFAQTMYLYRIESCSSLLTPTCLNSLTIAQLTLSTRVHLTLNGSEVNLFYQTNSFIYQNSSTAVLLV